MSDFDGWIDWGAVAQAQRDAEEAQAAAELSATLNEYTAKKDLGKINGLPTNPLDPNSASLAYNQGAYTYDGHYGQPVWEDGQIVGYDFMQHDITPGMVSNFKTDLQGNVTSRAVTPEGESLNFGDLARMATTMYGVGSGLGSLFGGLGAGAGSLSAAEALGGAEVAGGLTAAEASAAGLGGGFTGVPGMLGGAAGVSGAFNGPLPASELGSSFASDMAAAGYPGSAAGLAATGGAVTGAGGAAGAGATGVGGGTAGAAGTAGGLAGAANTASNLSTGLKVAGAAAGLAGAAGAANTGTADAGLGGQSLIDLANVTARNNLDMAKYTTNANRFNQSNQYGDSTWTYTPTYDKNGNETGGGWSQKTTLNPAQQALFNSQTAGNQGLSDTANTALRNSSQLSNPNLDLSKLPGYKGIDLSALPSAPISAGTTAQQAVMSRLQPTLGQYDNALSQRLANQGITLGSEAYNREMNLAGQKRNDLELQAAYQGISLDQAARQQALGEQQAQSNNIMSQRGQMLNEQTSAINTPLNTINALRSGSQVSNPQFTNLNAQQANVAGADALSAGQAQQTNALNASNASKAQNAGIFGGLAQLGTAAMLAPSGTFSGLFG